MSVNTNKQPSRLNKRGPFLYQFLAAKYMGERMMSLGEMATALREGKIECPPHIYSCGTILAYPGHDAKFPNGEMRGVSSDGVNWKLDVPQGISGKSGIVMLIDPTDYELFINGNYVRVDITDIAARAVTIDKNCKALFEHNGINFHLMHYGNGSHIGPVHVGHFDDSDELLVLTFLNGLSYESYTVGGRQ